MDFLILRLEYDRCTFLISLFAWKYGFFEQGKGEEEKGKKKENIRSRR